MKIKTLHDLFCDILYDTFDAEQHLLKALQKNIEHSTNPGLSGVFEAHLFETQNQVRRIERIFESLNIKPKKEGCEAIRGLLHETEEFVKHIQKGAVLDAALIAASQKIEHYEISAYGTLRTLAATLGYTEAEQLLQETLEEEKAADQKLSVLAKGSVNSSAFREAA